MTAPLYRFQQRSLLRLVARELTPGRMPVLERRAMDGRPYWLGEAGEVMDEMPVTPDDPPSSLLSESMGAGKTVIALALIASTKGQLAVPDRPERHTAFIDSTTSTSERSLFSILRRKINATPELLAEIIEQPLDQVRGDAWVRRLPIRPHYRFRPLDRVVGRRSARLEGQADNVTWTIRLVKTTLLVIPDELVNQWKDEASFHLASDPLCDHSDCDHVQWAIATTGKGKSKKAKVVTDERHISHDDLTVDKIAELDAVIISNSCLAKLFEQHNNRATSPLLLVHWRRIIVDEGDTLTRANSVTSLLPDVRTGERVD